MTAVIQQATLDWTSANLAVQAAVAKAETLQVRINVAVVDNGGHLLAFLRMPNAFIHSIDIAIDKAYSAVSFGFPTANWNEILQQAPLGFREGIILRPRLVVFAGGLPIDYQGQIVGGIGVSGASEEQDVLCAQAGLDALH
ncbi:GlcG/HbpS family heme-binding protein [Beggiatoa leptomitoformis]|uniref:Heme-binding protein n=1 Tax=Beggiatoa leptomitoformis TaxID=288004 RepID=A0A2N9YJ17_9GAMM|nr:heme-binding protein [Beggiatoa leptomitoformis]ALG66618.1 heme-binding protein [Beggiatoa leptomitoformis]AUI70528.1 heme-binding protein [Beggiatoa leptomitoformis]